MKRYSLTVKVREDYTVYADTIENEGGEWVKHKDVKPEIDRLEGDACDYSNWSNELYEENAQLKKLLNEFSNALEFAVKNEPRLIYFPPIVGCIKKISREVEEG